MKWYPYACDLVYSLQDILAVGNPQVSSSSQLILGWVWREYRTCYRVKISPGWIYLGYSATIQYLVFCSIKVSYKKEVLASDMYTVQVSALYSIVERIMSQWITPFVFLEVFDTSDLNSPNSWKHLTFAYRGLYIFHCGWWQWGLDIWSSLLRLVSGPLLAYLDLCHKISKCFGTSFWIARG